RRRGPMAGPGVDGAWGQQRPMSYPYAAAPPASPQMAAAMMRQSIPLDMMQMSGSGLQGDSGVLQTAYSPHGCPPGGCPPGGRPPGGCPPNMFVPPSGFLTPPATA